MAWSEESSYIPVLDKRCYRTCNIVISTYKAGVLQYVSSRHLTTTSYIPPPPPPLSPPSNPLPAPLPLHLLPKRIIPLPRSSRRRTTNRTPPIPIILPRQPPIPLLQLHPPSRLIMKTRIPSMSRAPPPRRHRIPRSSQSMFAAGLPAAGTVALFSATAAKAEVADADDDEGDEEDETDGDADFLAEFVLVRGGVRVGGVCFCEGYGGAADSVGVFRVGEGEGEV